jgi:hypothetical protein
LLEVGQQFTSNGNATVYDPVSHRRVVKHRRRRKKHGNAGHKWTDAQRQKFMKTMKGVWKKRRAEEKVAAK